MNSTYIEFTDIGKVTVKQETVDTSKLAPDEVIIQNEASIISTGTELARLYGLEKNVTLPFRPGYGSIGRIIEKGSNIQDYDIGDRVFYAGTHSRIQRFKHQQGHQWGHLFPVPDSLDPVVASIGCMAQIAMTAPNVTELKMGDNVAVFGLGLVGLLAAQLYKLMGANVIGIDPVKERCDIAREVGIDHIIDVEPGAQAEAIFKLTNGHGADVTVDAVGHSGVVLNCISSTAAFGQVILLGSPRETFNTDITPYLFDIHEKGAVIRGAHMWRYPVTPQRGQAMSVEWSFQTIFDLMSSEKLLIKPLISHIISPRNAPEAYQGLRENQKQFSCVVIDWSEHHE